MEGYGIAGGPEPAADLCVFPVHGAVQAVEDDNESRPQRDYEEHGYFGAQPEEDVEPIGDR